MIAFIFGLVLGLLLAAYVYTLLIEARSLVEQLKGNLAGVQRQYDWTREKFAELQEFVRRPEFKMVLAAMDEDRKHGVTTKVTYEVVRRQ